MGHTVGSYKCEVREPHLLASQKLRHESVGRRQFQRLSDQRQEVFLTLLGCSWLLLGCKSHPFVDYYSTFIEMK